MPVLALPKFLFSLISWAVLAAAVGLIWTWLQGQSVLAPDGMVRRVHGPGWMLWAGGAMLGWSALGRFVVLALLPRAPVSLAMPEGAVTTIAGPSGRRLRVASAGPAGAPTLILTHGWGLGLEAWGPVARRLAARYRVVLWDLPGLGGSSPPRPGGFSLDGFANALGAVVTWSGARRVVLVGHSIGGMTSQTLWRARPDLRDRIAGMALIDTTYANPLNTMWGGRLWRALQTPLIEPLNRLVIVLFPLFWLSMWQGYLSGFGHLAMRFAGFGAFGWREAVELTTRLACRGSPAVQARGNLAMIHWSMAEDLPAISAPVLTLTGERDIVTEPRAGALIADAVQEGRCELAEGCNHMGLLERPDVYAAEIERFAEEAFTRP